MSSSSIGAWPHHSDSRCPRISASSARRSAYSTSGVSVTEMDAVAMVNNPFTYSPHPEERALRARLEGWPRVRLLPPSFETLAAQAPQDEDLVAVIANHRARIRATRWNDGLHMPDFIRHVVERRVPVDLGLRRLEHH